MMVVICECIVVFVVSCCDCCEWSVMCGDEKNVRIDVLRTEVSGVRYRELIMGGEDVVDQVNNVDEC